jgi:hypothetical protein
LRGIDAPAIGCGDFDVDADDGSQRSGSTAKAIGAIARTRGLRCSRYAAPSWRLLPFHL